MEFFGLAIPLNICFCLEISRNYTSIIIAIVSNITVLVSHNTIFFGYFMPMSHGVNMKTRPSVHPPFSLLPGFHQVCLLFYNKYFILQAVIVFSVSKETKLHVDTNSITLSYSYHFEILNKELVRYC